MMRFPDLFAPDATVRKRLSAALVLSALLHAAVLYNTHGSGRGGAPSAGRDTLIVRLLPAEQPPAPVVIPDAARRESALDAVAPAPEAAATPLPVNALAPSTPGPNGPRQLSETRYYLGSELDSRATPLQAIEPEYPDDPGERERNVVLRVYISERGTVDNVAVQAAGAAAAFENSAREAFARARFTPGMLRGVPVKSQLTVEVKFDPGTATARSGEIATAVPQPAY